MVDLVCVCATYMVCVRARTTVHRLHPRVPLRRHGWKSTCVATLLMVSIRMSSQLPRSSRHARCLSARAQRASAVARGGVLRGGFALLPRPAESALLGGRGLPWIAGGLRGVTTAVARGLLAPAPAVALAWPSALPAAAAAPPRGTPRGRAIGRVVALRAGLCAAEPADAPLASPRGVVGAGKAVAGASPPSARGGASCAPGRGGVSATACGDGLATGLGSSRGGVDAAGGGGGGGARGSAAAAAGIAATVGEVPDSRSASSRVIR